MKTNATMRLVALAAILGVGLIGGSARGVAQAAKPQSMTPAPTGVLHQEELNKLVPATVFFAGQTATVQLRNAAGVRFAGGPVLFAVKVDTGGYATNIQERYQDYLITETPVLVGGQRLAPGAYGVGFLGQKLEVMDIGGKTMFDAQTGTDPGLKRPAPLQMIAQPDGSFRLYSGRTFVVLTLAQGQR